MKTGNPPPSTSCADEGLCTQRLGAHDTPHSSSFDEQTNSIQIHREVCWLILGRWFRKSGVHQLIWQKTPFSNRATHTSQVVQDFWTINSMIWYMGMLRRCLSQHLKRYVLFGYAGLLCRWWLKRIKKCLYSMHQHPNIIIHLHLHIQHNHQWQPSISSRT